MRAFSLRLRAWVVVAAMAVLGPVATTDAASFDFDSPVSLGSGGWSVDRASPASFGTAVDPNDPANNVLKHGVGGTPDANPFLNFQGAKYAVNQTGGVQVFSIDLYVGSDWATSSRSVQMWLGTQRDGVEDGYPGLAYRSGSALDPANYPADAPGTGFYVYDWGLGDYVFATAATGGWNTLQIVFTVGTGLEYFVNGTSVGEELDSDPNGVGDLYLQGYNFGTSHDIYWDNLRIEQRDPAVVPVPLAASAGFGLMGVLAIRRRLAARG